MSFAQNLNYAVVQVVHNLGAVATVGGSLSALRVRDASARKGLAHLVLAGWLTQAASGVTFGLVSYYNYHQLPDISGIAINALYVKIACVCIGAMLLATYIWQSGHWTEQRMNKAWLLSSILSVTALTAAAFLRWFS